MKKKVNQNQLNWELIQATRNGNLKLVKNLVLKGANPSAITKEDNNLNIPKGFVAVREVINFNKAEILEYFLTIKNIDVNAGQTMNYTSNAELFFTNMAHNRDSRLKNILKDLIKSGLNLNSKNLFASPITKSIQLGRMDLLEIMLKEGKNVELNKFADNPLESILTIAIQEVCNKTIPEKAIDLLIKYGVDVNPETPNLMHTPLSKAAFNTNFKLVQKLLDLKADVNPNNSNNTPLLSVIQQQNILDKSGNREKIIDLLLKSGADVNLINNNNVGGGQSPFMASINIGDVKLVKTMIENYKADINIFPRNDITGNNSLSFAINKDISNNNDVNFDGKERKNFEITKLLLDKFKDISDSILLSSLTNYNLLNNNNQQLINYNLIVNNIKTELEIHEPIMFNDMKNKKYASIFKNQKQNNQEILPHIEQGIIQIFDKIVSLDKNQKIPLKTQNNLIKLFRKIFSEKAHKELEKLAPNLMSKFKIEGSKNSFEKDKIEIIKYIVSKVENPNLKVKNAMQFEFFLKKIQMNNIDEDILKVITKSIVKKLGPNHLREAFEHGLNQNNNNNLTKILIKELKILNRNPKKLFLLGLKYDQKLAKKLLKTATTYYNKIKNKRKTLEKFEKELLKSLAHSIKQNDDLIEIIQKNFPKIKWNHKLDKDGNNILLIKAQNGNYSFVKKYINTLNKNGVPIFDVNHTNKHGNKLIDIISWKIFRDGKKELLEFIDILRKAGSMEPKENIVSFDNAINPDLMHNIANEKPIRKVHEYLKKKHKLNDIEIKKYLKEMKDFLIKNQKLLTDNTTNENSSNSKNKDVLKGILSKENYNQVLKNYNLFLNSQNEQDEANVKFYAHKVLARAWKESNETENVSGLLKMLGATSACITGQFMNLLKLYEKGGTIIHVPAVRADDLYKNEKTVLNRIVENLYKKYPDHIAQKSVFSFYNEYLYFYKKNGYKKETKFLKVNKLSSLFTAECYKVYLEESLKNKLYIKKGKHVISEDLNMFYHQFLNKIFTKAMYFDLKSSKNDAYIYSIIKYSEYKTLFKNPLIMKTLSEINTYFKIGEFMKNEFLNKLYNVKFTSKDFSSSIASLYKEKTKSFKDLSKSSKLAVKYFGEGIKEILSSNVSNKKLLTKIDAADYHKLFMYLIKNYNSDTKNSNLIFNVIANNIESKEIKLSSDNKFYDKVKNILNMMNIMPTISENLFTDINSKILSKKTKVKNWFKDFKKPIALSKYSKDGIEISKDIKSSLIDFMKLNVSSDLKNISDKNLYKFFDILSTNDHQLKSLIESVINFV